MKEDVDDSAQPDLIRAVRDGDVARVRAHIPSGIDIRDEEESTALICAAQEGNLEILELLLNAGADVNAQDYYGATALMFAAQEGFVEVVEALLRAGADASMKDQDGDTARDAARREGHSEILAVLS